MSAAVDEVPAIVGGSRAASPAESQGPGRGGKSGSAEAAIGGVENGKCVPSITAEAAGAAVRARAAAGILVVIRWVAVRAAAAGITWRSARITAVRQAFDAGIRGCAGQGCKCADDITRRASDPFPLGAIRVIGRERDVVRVGTRAAAQNAAATAAETGSIERHRSAERELRSNIDGQHAASCSV